MKIALIAILLLCLCPTLPCQQFSNFGAAGISYSPGASPAIAGTGLYARLIAGSGTYAFTAVDALPQAVRPFQVTTQFSTGFAQKVLTINGAAIYIPTAAGISYSGTNTGWAWSTGGLAALHIKGAWYLAPSVRIMKSSVADYAGYQLIGGILIGWGW